MTDICNNNETCAISKNGKPAQPPSQSETDDLVSSEVRKHIEKLLQQLNVKDYCIDISAGTVRGDNYLGIIAKVQVKGKNKAGENTTLNLICKSAPRGGAFRKITPIREAYQREIYIYNDVFPEFLKLQQERGVQDVFTSYAKYYSSLMNDNNEALIMEDMKAIGYKLCNRHEPLDYNHVRLALREYGRFHALSFALRDQKPEVFEKLAKNTQEAFFVAGASDELYKALKSQGDKALNALNPVMHKFAYEKFKSFQENLEAHVQHSVKAKSAGEHGVIGHGDCWVNNMLFKYGDAKTPNKPTNLCLLDWQLSRLGSPALDLSYFIFTCTDKALRDEHFHDLLKEYYDSFCTFLRQLGSDPEKLFPFEVLQQHLKKFSVYGLCMSVMVLFMMTSDVDEIPDFHNASDVQNVVDQFQYDNKNVEKYFTRIRGVILDFVKFKLDF